MTTIATKKKTKKLKIDERIYKLEEFFSKPAGTQLVRTLDWNRGSLWSIGFGQVMSTKTFFSGKTIEEALAEAEKAIKDGENFIADPWKRMERDVEKQKL